MRSLLCCLPVLLGLSACAEPAFQNNYTTFSTVSENEAFMPMLAIDTANHGYEMTNFYKPAVYRNSTSQKTYCPQIRRSTLENLAQNSW